MRHVFSLFFPSTRRDPIVFSATGAMSLSAWGIAPGNWLPQTQALKARLTFSPTMKRAFSAAV